MNHKTPRAQASTPNKTCKTPNYRDFTPCDTLAQKRKLCAFTLAEVLITLAIIGVVAALTIPTVVRNYQKQQYATAAAKAVTVMQQGLKQMMIDSGCTNLECTGLFSPDLTTEEWNDKIDVAIKKAFKVLKSSKSSDDKTDIVETVKYIMGNKSVVYFDRGYQFITADGMIFVIGNRGCQSTTYSELSKFKKECFGFSVDTNGHKPPNQLGKDVFGDISVSNDGNIYPATSYEWAMAFYGQAETVASNYWRIRAYDQCGEPGKKLSEMAGYVGSGQNCLARIMEEGWRITYF